MIQTDNYNTYTITISEEDFQNTNILGSANENGVIKLNSTNRSTYDLDSSGNESYTYELAKINDSGNMIFESNPVNILVTLHEIVHILGLGLSNSWSESNYSAVDIFTCGHNMKPELATNYLINTLIAKEHQLRIIQRTPPLRIQN